ncbi:MAG TPA: YfbR-like 5'-deoxynucleotidase, partial [Pseudohongiella sp.]|nr:YfbR-like 5'-deoxynucleotidase [Pseudohongiella sp.]
QQDFRKVLIHEELSDEVQRVIKSADTICAWIKCRAEVQAGNAEFARAEEDVRRRLEKIDSPEVRYFMDTFAPSYGLTLDELLK